MKRGLIALALVATLAACSGDEPKDGGNVSERFPPECGLPTPQPNQDAGRVPAGFLLDGEAEIITAQESGGGFIASFNVPYSVEEGFDRMKEAASAMGFEVVQEDFEGFEAEVYVKKGNKLGVVQVRTSRCNEASLALINIVDQRRAPPPPTPTHSRSR